MAFCISGSGTLESVVGISLEMELSQVHPHSFAFVLKEANSGIMYSKSTMILIFRHIF